MSFSGRIRTPLITALVSGAAALLATGCGLLTTASSAVASSNLQTMFEDPAIESPTVNPVNFNPMPELKLLRYLGVNVIRIGVGWGEFAPDPTSSTVPAVSLSSPSSYSWGWLATDVKDASQLGIKVDLMLSGAPSWAVGAGAPSGVEHSAWEPNPGLYGDFVHAVGTEFPSVHFFELWNEANWGPGMAPQYLNSSVPVSAKYYRELLDTGYSALQQTGHGHDSISIGNLSQDGSSSKSEFGTAAPLTFMKTLYCLSNSYKQLTGSAASEAGCSGSKSSFKAANPALFSGTGVGVHPYPYGNAPSKTLFPSQNGAEFGELPQFIKGLDKIQSAYGSHRHPAIYNTEYGYATRPPETAHYEATPATAAKYLNQAEYMSWKNSSIQTYDQYEMIDSTGWFKTGLFFYPKTAGCSSELPCPKPSFYAYRIPVWLPVTKAKRGHSLEVWGQARAAGYARKDTGRGQKVAIQFAGRGSSSYRTIKTVRITNSYGYFDTHIKFPKSGSVRLTWTYPASDQNLVDPLASVPGFPAAMKNRQIYSRTTSITLH